MFNCVFVTFPCGILGQVWYLIVSIPDLCHLSYFVILFLKICKFIDKPIMGCNAFNLKKCANLLMYENAIMGCTLKKRIFINRLQHIMGCNLKNYANLFDILFCFI